MKVHIAKKASGNKVMINRTECGQGTRSNVWPLIARTNRFNEIIQEHGKKAVCKKCLAAAKIQKRV